MTERHKLRQQIIKDRLNNPDNLWCYEKLSIDLNLIDPNLLDFALLSLSKNSSLTIEYILKHKDKNWNWNKLSKYANINLDIIKNNIDLPWNWTYISINQNITWDNVLNNPDDPWDWEFLSRLKPITWSIIKQNINLFKQKLDWSEIEYTFDFEILENLGLSVPWNFENLSNNSNINWDIVIKYKNQNWNWDLLCYNKDLSLDIIKKNIDLPWCWESISLNLKITSQVLSTNQNLDWDWDNLSGNESITEDILIDHKDKPWDYGELSNCRNITKEFVLNNPDKPWNYDHLGYNNIIIADEITNWYIISKNLEISFEFILEHINKFVRDGNWFFLSISKNITYENVNNNRNMPWNWDALSQNENMFNIENEYIIKTRKYMAAYKIRQTWLRAYYNPEYLICQRRLSREYENLTSN